VKPDIFRPLIREIVKYKRASGPTELRAGKDFNGYPDREDAALSDWSEPLDDRSLRNQRVQPKTAFARFPLV
jgi:hypothetical protein